MYISCFNSLISISLEFGQACCLKPRQDIKLLSLAYPPLFFVLLSVDTSIVAINN